MMSLDKKTCVVILSLLFVAGFFLRLYPVRIAHWWDETVYLQHAEILLSGHNNYDEFAFRAPLLPIVFAGIFLLQDSAPAAHGAVALLGLLIPLSLFLIGRYLYGWEVGMVGAVLAIFSDFFVQQSRALMPDSPAAGLFGLGLFFLLAAERRKAFFLVSGLLFALAVLMKLSVIVIVFVVPLFFLLCHRSLSSIVLWGSGFCLGIAPYLLWAQKTQGFFLEPFLVGQRQVLGEGVAILYYVTTLPFALPIIVCVGLCAFLILSWRRFQHPEIFLLLISGIFLLYLTITPHKEMRYFLPGLIPLMVLSARGINLLGKTYHYRLIHLSIAFLLCLPVVSTLTHLPSSFVDRTVSNEKRVSDYIRNNTPEQTVIYTNFNYPVFAYYAKRSVTRVYSDTPIASQAKKPGVVIAYQDRPYLDLDALIKEGALRRTYASEGVIVYQYTATSDLTIH